MLNPLWQSTETFVSYHDVVDKWGLKAALREGVIDALSAAIALNIVFPDKTVTEITNDLSDARKRAIRDSKENVR